MPEKTIPNGSLLGVQECRSAGVQEGVTATEESNLNCQMDSDAMWVKVEDGQIIGFAQTSEVSKTSEVYDYHPHCITTVK